MKACFFNFMTWVQKVSFLIVLDFCDQVLAMLDDESCTGRKKILHFHWKLSDSFVLQYFTL